MDSMNSCRTQLLRGLVIPAHPLALTANRQLDERHQRALTRYYLSAGAGGIAIGVHTTQFEIHRPEVGLYLPVLELAGEVVKEFSDSNRRPVKVAGIVGATAQAVKEAVLASDLGYDCGLLSLGVMEDDSDDALIAHAQAVAEVIPLFGFYLQPAVGGRILSFDFWRRFVEIGNVLAIKIAPFNRYQTLDVVRAVIDSGRQGEIALYTGNDDNIILDLITPFCFLNRNKVKRVRIVGGLLGQWATWTLRAVEFLEEAHAVPRDSQVPSEWLTRNAEMTDVNSALFDVANQFAGCIPGIHEVLRRQGLMKGLWCLNPHEGLSSGQVEEIERVYSAYPHLNDDDFVLEHLDAWLK